MKPFWRFGLFLTAVLGVLHLTHPAPVNVFTILFIMAALVLFAAASASKGHF